MLITLIQKEVMHHILSVRFVALLLMCLLLVPLTLSTSYRNYQQNLVDYQEAVKLANIEETTMNPGMPLDPELEVSKLILKPTPLSVFANGLADALPSYLGMTPQWGYTRGTRSGVLSLLSVRASRFSVRRRYCFQSTRVTVYVRCGCRGTRSGHPSNYLS